MADPLQTAVVGAVAAALGYIVNLGGAKAEDVRQLMDLARAEVKRQFAVELIAEVKLAGEWDESAETKNG